MTMLWSSLRFLGQTSLYIATTCTTWPTATFMMSQAFYYLNITTTAQSAYSRSHNKFWRYVFYNMLFYHSIIFCFERKYMLIYFCQYRVIKWKIMLPLYSDQTSLLTVVAVVIHRPSLLRPPVYNDHRNLVPQVVIIHRFGCIIILFWCVFYILLCRNSLYLFCSFSCVNICPGGYVYHSGLA